MLLDIKVMWGRVVLAARQFGMGETITVSNRPRASFQLSLEQLPSEPFTLASPDGSSGHLIHAAPGMEVEVMRDGEPLPLGESPSQGAARAYALGHFDRVRLRMGQLVFVIRYVSAMKTIKRPLAASLDDEFVGWFVLVLIAAVGMLLVFKVTPMAKTELADHRQILARLAKYAMPSHRKEMKEPDGPRSGCPRILLGKANTGHIPCESPGCGWTDGGCVGRGGLCPLWIPSAIFRRSMRDSNPCKYYFGPGSRRPQDVAVLGHRGHSDIQVVHQNTKVIGGLSQEVVGQYIKRYWAQIKFCYERELTKNPNLYGKVTITFTIGGNGRISEAQVMQTTMNNANVEECILRVIRRIIFPQPKGGGQVIVTYPFLFQLAGG